MRWLKVLLVLLIVAVAVGGGAVLGLRAGRDKVGQVSEVKPGFATVTNAAGISLFAARVAEGPHVIVFDTGLDPQGRPIDAVLAALKATRDDVTDVFLTHGHVDHIAGVPALKKAHVHLGAADIPLAAGKQSPDSLVAMLLGKALETPPISVDAPINGPAVFPMGAADSKVADTKSKDAKAPADAKAVPDAKTIKAFPVPGHTAGSYVFLYDGILVTGDVMIFKQGRLEPPMRLFNPHPDENKAAIRSLKTQLGNETIDIVCTAHGGCTPKGLGRNLLDELISRV